MASAPTLRDATQAMRAHGRSCAPCKAGQLCAVGRRLLIRLLDACDAAAASLPAAAWAMPLRADQVAGALTRRLPDDLAQEFVRLFGDEATIRQPLQWWSQRGSGASRYVELVCELASTGVSVEQFRIAMRDTQRTRDPWTWWNDLASRLRRAEPAGEPVAVEREPDEPMPINAIVRGIRDRTITRAVHAVSGREWAIRGASTGVVFLESANGVGVVAVNTVERAGRFRWEAAGPLEEDGE